MPGGGADIVKTFSVSACCWRAYIADFAGGSNAVPAALAGKHKESGARKVHHHLAGARILPADGNML